MGYDVKYLHVAIYIVVHDDDDMIYLKFRVKGVVPIVF